ncbi:MAG: DMT family transporter [Symploca sp. SIO2E9]|nr:DMT family transporter [Symploca sp. SIO2E9]
MLEKNKTFLNNLIGSLTHILTTSDRFKPFFNRATIIAIIALLTARLISSLGLILLKLGGSWIGENETVFWREAIGLILFAAIETGLILFNRQFRKDHDSPPKNNYTPKIIAFLVGAGIAATLYMMFGVWSLSFTSVTNVAVIDCTLPIFTILGGSILFGQMFDRRFIIGAVIAVAGAILIALADFYESTIQLYGDALVFISTFFYATYWLLVEQIRATFSTTMILLWRCAVGTITLIPILWLSGSDHLVPNSWQEWLLVIAIALLSQVLAQGLAVYSLKKLSSSFVALSMLVIPLFSHIEAKFIFSETTSWINYFGGLIVLWGMYLAISGKGAFK